MRPCPDCGEATTVASARWCGRCGARLGPPTRRPTRAAASPDGTSGRAPALVGAQAGPAVLDAEDQLDAAPVARRLWSPRARAGVVVAAILAVVAALALRPEPAVVYDARGFTERGDAGRTGVVSLAPLSPPTRVAWETDVGAVPGRHHVRSAGDTVIEQTGAGTLAVRDGASGAVRWLRRGLDPAAGPVVRAGSVVVVPTPGHLHAFAVADGTPRWEQPVDGDTPRPFPLPDGGVLVWAPSTHTLTAHDADTGAERWRLVTTAPGLAASIVDVTVGGAGIGLWLTSPPGLRPDSPIATHLVAVVDPDTGGVRYTVDLDDGGDGGRDTGLRGAVADVVAVGAEVVATLAPEGVHLRHPAGTVRRAVATGRPVQMGATDDVLVAMTPTDGLVGIDLGTGDQRWHRPDLDADDVDRLTVTDGLALLTGFADVVLDAATGRSLAPAGGLEPASLRGEVAVPLLPAWDGSALTARDRTGQPVWERPRVADATPSPAVAAGRVFVPTRAGVEVLDVTDGTTSWGYHELRTAGTAELGAVPSRTPAVSDTTVLVSPGPVFGRSPGLVALERGGGVRVWDREGDLPIVRGPLTLAGETAFVPIDTEIHGYDVRTGRRAFAAVTGALLGPLVVTREHVIGGPTREPGPAGGEEAVAILRRDRSESWRVPLDPCSGPAVAGDRVVWGTADGVVAHDESDGAVVWETATSSPVCLDPVVAGGHVVVVEDPGRLRALDAVDGRPRWDAELAEVAVAAPVVAGEHVLVPLLDGTLTAYTLTDGTPAWSFPLDGVAAASPTVLDGRVLVLLRDGRLVALTA